MKGGGCHLLGGDGLLLATALRNVLVHLGPTELAQGDESFRARILHRTLSGRVSILVHLLSQEVSTWRIVAGVELSRLEDTLSLCVGHLVGDDATAHSVSGGPGNLGEVTDVEVKQIEALCHHRRSNLDLVVPLLDDVLPLSVHRGLTRLVDVQILAYRTVVHCAKQNKKNINRLGHCTTVVDRGEGLGVVITVLTGASTLVAVVCKLTLVGMHLRHIGQLGVPLHLEHVGGGGKAQLGLISARNQVAIVVVHVQNELLVPLVDATLECP